MGTLPFFLYFLSKVDNFGGEFLFTSPDDENPQKWVYSWRKEFAPRGTIVFS